MLLKLPDRTQLAYNPAFFLVPEVTRPATEDTQFPERWNRPGVDLTLFPKLLVSLMMLTGEMAGLFALGRGSISWANSQHDELK